MADDKELVIQIQRGAVKDVHLATHQHISIIDNMIVQFKCYNKSQEDRKDFLIK
jgi:hypothetical protein